MKLLDTDSFELIEYVIRALEKVASENARPVLLSGGLQYLTQLLGFLDSQQQRSAIFLMNESIKSAKKSKDLEKYVLPALDKLEEFIRGDEGSKNLVEAITQAVLNTCEGIVKMCEPGEPQLQELVDKVASGNLLKSILNLVVKGTTGANYSMLALKSWNNIIKVLKLLCMNSPFAYRAIISESLLGTLHKLLSFKELSMKEGEGVAEGVILLLDAMLPYKHLLSAHLKPDMAIVTEIEFAKKNILQSQKSYLKIFGELILPQVIHSYRDIAATVVRLNCLQVVDKILFICSHEVISGVLTPQLAAQFLYEVFCSNEPVFICFALSIAEVIFQRVAKTSKDYLQCMVREGVVEQIKLHQSSDYLHKKYSQSESFGTASPYIQYFASFNCRAPNKSLSLFVGKGSARPQLASSQSLRHPVNYMQSTAAKLLRAYELIKGKEEFKEVQQEFATLQKTVERLKVLLRIGTLGTRKDWDKLFKHLAVLTIDKRSFTTYEAHHTSLFLNLYYALCVLPVEYKQKVAGKKYRSVKFDKGLIRNYAVMQREDLEQMAMRHKSFVEWFNGTSLQNRIELLLRVGNAMVELVSKLQESFWSVKDSSEDSHESFLFSHRRPLQKKKLMVVYTPGRTHLTPSDLRRVTFKHSVDVKDVRNPLFRRRHKLFEMLHSLTFGVDCGNTFKEVERFLKEKIRSVDDIQKLKGYHYYVTMKEQKEIAIALEDPIVLKQFVDEQNAIQDREEATHSLDAEDRHKATKCNTLSKCYLNNPGTKLSIRFFSDGLEVRNKEQCVFDVVGRQSNVPGELYAAFNFQLSEKVRKPLKRVHAPKAPHEPCIEEKGYLFKGLQAEEQQVLSLCQLQLKFDIPQIEDLSLIARLKLLKLIHECCKNVLIVSKQPAEIREKHLVNSQLEAIIKRQLRELPSISLKENWTKEVCCQCPYMASKDLRTVLFKICAFPQSKIKRDEEDARAKRVKAEADRRDILGSGMQMMGMNVPSECVIEVNFVDEAGVGTGPTLEFYALSALMLRSLGYLWRPMESGALFPAPVDSKAGSDKANQEIIRHFRYMGWLVARGISDERLVDLPFADLFYELVLEKPLTLIDIVRIDSKIGKFLMALSELNRQKELLEHKDELSLDQRNAQVEALTLDGCSLSDLGLTFVLQGYETIELRRSGAVTPLTIHSLNEYLELTAHFTLHKTLKRQVNAFKEGFNLVLPVDSLRFFQPAELESVVCGDKASAWDIPMLQQCIVPVHGYDRMSLQYDIFLRYLADLPKEKQRLFLQYATGSPRLPLGGLKNLTPLLSVTKRITPEGESPDLYLPSVMTCQNYIKMPEYSSYEVLKEKFDYAISEGQGYFVLS